MDSLAALVADPLTPEERVAVEFIREHAKNVAARDLLAIVDRLAAALRPFTAPVGVEAFEGLRREHECLEPLSSEECTDSRCCAHGAASCVCGASAHNTRVDALRAAHVAALGEVERLRGERSVSLCAISDALAGPNAARNCDFRSPTAAEVTETATRLRDRFERTRDSLTALRSAILDGPDPSGCGKCGSLTCDRKAAGEVAVANLPTSEYEAATERYRLAVAACESRPAVDWRAQLAKLREVAR